MSKERARRRAAREAARLETERRAEAARRRRAGVRRLVAPLTGPWAAWRRRARARAGGALTRRRTHQDGVLAGVLVVCHILLWTTVHDWWIRVPAAVLTVAAWPLLTVMIFDRRTNR